MNDPDERPDAEPQREHPPDARPPASAADDDGAVPGLTPSAGVRVLRAIRVPGILLLIGFALTVVGPFPGLGAFLVIGAALVTFVIGMTALVGR